MHLAAHSCVRVFVFLLQVSMHVPMTVRVLVNVFADACSPHESHVKMLARTFILALLFCEALNEPI